MNKNIQRMIGQIKYFGKKNAPELLLGGALVTGTACVATTIIATTKAEEITRKLRDDKAQLCAKIENDTVYVVDSKKAVRAIYKEATIGYAKKYAVPAALFLATSGLVFGSYKIQKNRQIALSASLASASLAYSSLLSKIKNGAEHGLTAEEVLNGVEVVKKVDEETGEVSFEKTEGTILGTLYDYRFDKNSPVWEHDKYQNMCTLSVERNWANDKLRLEGFVFLNDVLYRLGLPRSKAGQFLGWKLDGDGDGYIDFGITDCSDIEGPAYDDNAFHLSFNVDGDILTNFK